MDLDVGVALVVLQPHVELRLMALDQRHLEDQRFQLRTDHDPLDIRDLPHQPARFLIMLGGSMEIGAHPVAQVDRLAHVDDAPLIILHQVAAGLIRERVQNLLEMFFPIHRNDFNTLREGSKNSGVMVWYFCFAISYQL